MTINPAITTTTKDEWKKVATAVTSCRIFAIDSTARYMATYRLTGQAAPSNTTEKKEGLPISADGLSVSVDDAVDVYVFAFNAGGSVLVHA